MDPSLPESERALTASRLDELAATRGPMPPVELAVIGTTTGGPLRGEDGGPAVEPSDVPVARTVVSLVMDAHADAMRAASIVPAKLGIGASFVFGLPWTDLYTDVTADVSPGSAVVRISLTSAPDFSGTRCGCGRRTSSHS